MDYARLEFGGGEGGGGINTLPCNDQTEALCMFTPMQWKRIIRGLVPNVGMVKERVQSSVIAIDDIQLMRNIGNLQFKKNLCNCMKTVEPSIYNW